MNDHQAHLRKLWKQYWKEEVTRCTGWAKLSSPHPPPRFLSFPTELRGLTCGAKTRAGAPCKRRDLYSSGRCRLHGGLSTGPKGK